MSAGPGLGRIAPYNDGVSFSVERLGRAIGRRRIELRLSTSVLAERAGVSDEDVLALEAGSGEVAGVDLVAAIARALGVGLDDLLVDAGLPGSRQRGAGDLDETDLDEIYRDLNPINRRALLRIAQVLRESQEQHRTDDQVGPVEMLDPAHNETEQIANFSREMQPGHD